jgi:hypothetical protein
VGYYSPWLTISFDILVVPQKSGYLKLPVSINFIDLLPCGKIQVYAHEIAQSADYFVNVLAL